jgi:hypothetical protein
MLNEFVDFVKNSPINSCFYHFTDKRNVPSIRKSGLLSMRSLRANGMVVPACGGNQWSLDADINSGMDAYVHLCFLPEHPMEYIARKEGRIESTTWIRIEPAIMLLSGVMLTKEVSNKSGVVPMMPLDALSEMHTDVIYTRTDWSNPGIQEKRNEVKKYEILVPSHVPINFIMNSNG